MKGRAGLVAEYRTWRERSRLEPAAARRWAEVVRAAATDAFERALADLIEAAADFVVGDYDLAESLAERALAAFSSSGERRFVGDALMALGNIHLERGELEEAAARYSDAADQWEERGLPDDLGRVYNNLGLVAWRMRDLGRAEEHFERALTNFGARADPSRLGNLHNNLGLVYEDRGDHVAAEREWQRAISLLTREGDSNFLANALSNLGDLEESRGALAAALALQERALALRLEIGHQRGVVGSRIALGRLFLALDDPGEAGAQLDSALELARKMGLRKHEADAEELRARVLELRWDLVGALAAQRRAAHVRSEVFNAQMAARVNSLQLRFETRQARLVARRTAEENARLQVAMAEVSEAAAARTRFLGVVSHEMRTPLTSVIGAAELLAQRPGDAGYTRLVGVISSSAQALLSTIEDMLDFSRLSTGHLSISYGPVDVQSVGEAVMATVSGATLAKDLRTSLVVDENVPLYGISDFARLRQVLINLVLNGVKFTDRGSVSLAFRWSDGWLTCLVSDTGIGISEELQRRLFEPFTQEDTTPTRRHRGAGLGLAICRRVVGAMKGTLSVTSSVGVGSAFEVRVPFPEADEPSRPASAPVEAHSFRLLLVDDNAELRDVLTALARLCGAHVEAVESGAAAVERAEEANFDVVVLDLHMPGMDGVECARRLRERHGAEPKLLALSGALGRGSAALQEGIFDAALAKPASLAQLRRALAALGFPKT